MGVLRAQVLRWRRAPALEGRRAVPRTATHPHTCAQRGARSIPLKEQRRLPGGEPDSRGRALRPASADRASRAAWFSQGRFGLMSISLFMPVLYLAPLEKEGNRF